jgi:Protein of unknown function (DUF4058)
MPLRDHFHLPLSEQNPWEGFHSAWANTMVRYLNGSWLPRRFRAVPQVHLGPFVETDLATYDEEFLTETAKLSAEQVNNGSEVALWYPDQAVQTLEIDLPGQDVFEVRVFDDRRGMRLVAVVELVSPANKDRPEHRQAFVTKCAAYLQEQVNVVLVDVVTTRHANLHRELLTMLAPATSSADDADLYCVTYRNRKSQDKWHLDFLPYTLVLGSPLPTVPLWLAGNLSAPLDLEKTYKETCQVLRIESE